MAGMSLDHSWAFAFGILGSVVSFMVFLAPVTTFYRVYRKKSTEGFQSVPYVVLLFSSMLWIYYAVVKSNSYVLITINSFGCVIETIYIVMYLIYAPRRAKIRTIEMLLFLNVLVFGMIVVFTTMFSKGFERVQLLGWICVGFAVIVFIAPLSIIKLVVQTKSVEYMSFSLSLFLTLSAVCWFAYGMLTKDRYVTIPNILGFIFGVVQMVLYMCYKGSRRVTEQLEQELDNRIVAVVIDQDQPIRANNEKVGEEHDENSKKEDMGGHEEVEMTQSVV